jgi:hypothetical protein
MERGEEEEANRHRRVAAEETGTRDSVGLPR